jgi:hypothetical protein
MVTGTKGYDWTLRTYGPEALLPPDCVDEVMFGFYEDGSTVAEVAMRWYRFDGPSVPRLSRGQSIARLEVFTGSWRALAQLSDVIAALADIDERNITAAEFCGILEAHGFQDMAPKRYRG